MRIEPFSGYAFIDDAQADGAYAGETTMPWSKFNGHSRSPQSRLMSTLERTRSIANDLAIKWYHRYLSD